MGMLRKFVRRMIGRSNRDKNTAPTTSRREVLPSAPETPPSAADAESLATMECGAQELRERLSAGETVTILDVREPYETATGILPGARCIPLRELSTRWEELKDADEIVCYCAAGARSYDAALLLRRNGLINATSLEGGIGAWRAIGGETASPPPGG